MSVLLLHFATGRKLVIYEHAPPGCLVDESPELIADILGHHFEEYIVLGNHMEHVSGEACGLPRAKWADLPPCWV